MTAERKDHMKGIHSPKSLLNIRNLTSTVATQSDIMETLVSSSDMTDYITYLSKSNKKDRILIDTSIYKGMYEKLYKKGKEVKVLIETLIENQINITKDRKYSSFLIDAYYPYLCKNITKREGKIQEMNVYPTEQIGINKKDRYHEANTLIDTDNILGKNYQNAEKILHNNNITIDQI